VESRERQQRRMIENIEKNGTQWGVANRTFRGNAGELLWVRGGRGI